MFLCLQPKLMTLAAAGAMRCRHSPNGCIQWLLVKPGMCSIGRCAPHCTAPSAWWSKLPATSQHFLSLLIFYLHTTIDNNHVMANINYKCARLLILKVIIIYWYIVGAHRQRWMPFWPPFLATGKLIKNTSSHRIKLIKRLFYQFIQNQAKALLPSPFPRGSLHPIRKIYNIPCHRSGKQLTIVVMFLVELCWW